MRLLTLGIFKIMIGFNKKTIKLLDSLGFCNDPQNQLRCVFYNKDKPSLTILLGNYPHSDKDGAYIFLWNKRGDRGHKITTKSELIKRINDFNCA